MSLERAAAMACRVLVARSVTALPVDPMAILRCCRDTVVWTYGEAADQLNLPAEAFERLFGAAEAFTLRQGGRYLVVYRPGGNPARLRFTLAHELGHRLLGEDEQAADAFASCLLCPEPVIARLAERFRPLTAEQVASACYVSVSCARALAQRPILAVDPALLKQVDDLLAPAVAAVRPVPAQRTDHILSKTPERFWETNA